MGRTCGGRHYDHSTDTASEVTADGRIKVSITEDFDIADTIADMKDSLDDIANFADDVKIMRDALEYIKLLSKKMETHLSIMTDEEIKDEDTDKL